MVPNKFCVLHSDTTHVQESELCAVMSAKDGRWRARPCSEEYRTACRTEDGRWGLEEGQRGSCPEGSSFAVPAHAKENAALQRELLRSGAETSWLPLQGKLHAQIHHLIDGEAEVTARRGVYSGMAAWEGPGILWCWAMQRRTLCCRGSCSSMGQRHAGYPSGVSFQQAHTTRLFLLPITWGPLGCASDSAMSQRIVLLS